MEKSILRFLTAGSVDDGKSSFLGRLLFDSDAVYEDHLKEVEKLSTKAKQSFTDLSLLIDGLESERNQKITIDAAYRYFSTKARKFIIADSPGHEEYTRNMAVAASNSDVAVILIDAGKGIRNQSLRHSYIAHLFGIKKFIIAINKMDLVDYDQQVFEKIKEEYKSRSTSFLSDIFLEFVPVSALKGDNIVNQGESMKWYDGKTILELLENINIEKSDFAETRFLVQNVSKANNKRYFQGRLVSGDVEKDQSIVVWPGKKEAKVTEIIHSGQNAVRATAGNSISIALNDEIDIERGSVISNVDSSLNSNTKFDAGIVWFSDNNFILDENKEYLLKINHNLVNSKITNLNYVLDINNFNKNNASELTQNDISNVTFSLSKQVPFDLFKHSKFSGSFLVIDKVTNETLACGTIQNTASNKKADILSDEEKYKNFIDDVLKLGEKHFGVKLSIK